MWILVLLILILGAVTGSLGQILEVAAGVVLGIFLFVVGVSLAIFSYARHRFRRAFRDWERGSGHRYEEGHARDEPAGPPGLPPGRGPR